LVGPDSYLFRGHTVEEFMEAYEPRLELFLQAMERLEKAREGSDVEKPLSYLMRESWITKRFWFNYAIRKPFDVEVLFANCLKENGAGISLLDEEARAGLEPFVGMKMKQLEAYDQECAKSLWYAHHLSAIRPSILGFIYSTISLLDLYTVPYAENPTEKYVKRSKDSEATKFHKAPNTTCDLLRDLFTRSILTSPRRAYPRVTR
jgi:hypothetical protein